MKKYQIPDWEVLLAEEEEDVITISNLTVMPGEDGEEEEDEFWSDWL